MRFPHIKDFIFNSLGFPTVKVELTNSQIEFCAEEAVKKWHQYNVSKEIVFFDTVANQVNYDLDEINDDIFCAIKKPYDKYILDVIYEPTEINYADDGFYLLVNQFYYYYAYNNKQLMSDYNLFKGYIEDLRRTLGTKGTWQVFGKDLYLSPMPRTSLQALIIYKGTFDDHIADENEWVMRYARANAKAILGQVRGKYAAGLTGPSGAITFNSADLLSQSEKEKDALLKELIQRAGPVGIITG